MQFMLFRLRHRPFFPSLPFSLRSALSSLSLRFCVVCLRLVTFVLDSELNEDIIRLKNQREREREREREIVGGGGRPRRESRRGGKKKERKTDRKPNTIKRKQNTALRDCIWLDRHLKTGGRRIEKERRSEWPSESR